MQMQRIVIDVPEQILLAEKTDAEQFGRQMRLLAAVKLFELGRLTSGRAAQLAGIPRVEFLMRLEEFHVFPFADELNELETLYAKRD